MGEHDAESGIDTSIIDNGFNKAKLFCNLDKPSPKINCDAGGKCESAIAKRLKRCVSEGFPDGGKSDLQWGSQLLHCTRARLLWGGDNKAACLPCICDYVQANTDPDKWDQFTDNFCSKYA